jgi:dolichol-phosphate mannosyltransferase
MTGVPVTLVIPAYNEEPDLPTLLASIKRSLSDWADYEVILVDDGSIDRTTSIAHDAALHMPVEVIRHSHNQGLGGAIRTGLRAAAESGRIVVTMDADNSQDPALIRLMLERMTSEVDVVIASRFQSGSREVGVPALRRLLSHLSSAVLRLVIRYPGVRDYTCGFRAYRAGVLRRLIHKYGESAFVQERGFACMFELLLKLRTVGARIAEVPLVLRYDLKVGSSKMRIMRTIWRYWALLSKLPKWAE